MANENIRFRIASQDDTMALKQLIESAFRAEDSRQGWVGNADLASRFSIEAENIANVIANPDSTFLMASDTNGTLLGTVGVSKHDPDSARLFMLAVDPQCHRGGIGKQILTHAEDYCQRVWCPKVLGLNALRPARLLYRGTCAVDSERRARPAHFPARSSKTWICLMTYTLSSL